jgi:hypothetical protein
MYEQQQRPSRQARGGKPPPSERCQVQMGTKYRVTKPLESEMG